MDNVYGGSGDADRGKTDKGLRIVANNSSYLVCLCWEQDITELWRHRRKVQISRTRNKPPSDSTDMYPVFLSYLFRYNSHLFPLFNDDKNNNNNNYSNKIFTTTIVTATTISILNQHHSEIPWLTVENCLSSGAIIHRLRSAKHPP